jgi:hypothetical protein
VKQAGQWNDSHEELQHRVTRGVGGYEYGEWLYPTCYFDMDEELLTEFPAGIGYGFPQPLNLDLKVDQGAYLLVVGAKARIGAGSLISVAVNPNADLMKSPDFVPKEMVRYAGEYEVPYDGEWHRYVVPVNLYMSGKNRIQLAHCLNGREGHWFDALELVESPIRHEYPEYGGHKAELEESYTADLGGSVLHEKRSWEALSDLPYIAVTIERVVDGAPLDLATVHGCEGYDGLLVDGREMADREERPIEERAVLRDSTGFRPDLNLVLLRRGSVKSVRWEDGRLLLLSKDVSREKLRLAIAVAEPGVALEERIPVSELGAAERSLVLPEGPVPLTVKNDRSVPVTRVYRIGNPSPGPYLVMEDGWWLIRGGQPARSESGGDFLKLYLPASGEVQVQRSGYILDVVKPGYGCQHTVRIADVARSGSTASCRVLVSGVTPALFAPRIRFNGEIGTARLDGSPWAYADTGGVVFLPNRPGEYRVEVDLVDAPVGDPRLCRAACSVASASYDSEAKVFEFEAEFPPWVRSLPEAQKYMALIAYDKSRYRRIAAENAEIATEGRLGDVVAFKPGVIRLRFEGS